MLLRLAVVCSVLTSTAHLIAQEGDLTRAISAAGENAPQIQQALDMVPDAQRDGMKFLVQHMPEPDLRSVKADFLLRNVDEAYRTWKAAKWEIPEDIFLNNVLPFASINENRDDFRKPFRERFAPLVNEAKSPGEAAAILNNTAFKELNVKYSRKRRRADQGPFESIESGLASCTGLSVLLIDACRSVGVPARFVGTPLWSDGSGNHSWVEVWDDGWHFTGAAEPTGMELDKGWFIGRSSKAQRDNPRHAIYAVSYKRTPIHFPLVWDRSIDYVHAVNVTDRYANKAKELPPNYLQAMFKTYGISGDRCCVPFTIKDESGNVVYEGKTKDESFDGNDHTTVPLPVGESFKVEFSSGEKETITTKTSDSNSQLFTFAVEQPPQPRAGFVTEPNALASDGRGTKGQQTQHPRLAPAAQNPSSQSSETGPSPASPSAVDDLKKYLKQDSVDWQSIGDQPFAKAPLTKADTDLATELLVEARRTQLRKKRKAEHEAGELQLGEHKMPFFHKTFGEKPERGRSLFISMHGGGGAPKRVNDRQWNNQKRLYKPTEGVYVAPRAPTDTWNLWHQKHIMPLFDRLIENMVLFEEVNPNRVYIMGYSAGGDGVYQLAPRMADRLAAAAMMAGHPNDAQPLNLSNIGFALYMGGKDGAYKRNQVAAEWGEKLKSLRDANPDQYEHLVTIYPDKGHWMGGEDASALPWMLRFTRNPFPKKLVWRKDGNPQPRFYWLGADVDSWKSGELVTADIDGQMIKFEPPAESSKLRVYLNDDLVDLDQDLTIHWPSGVQTKKLDRTIVNVHASLSQRFDPTCVFSASAAVE